MREEYDIENLNPRGNPHSSRLKRQEKVDEKHVSSNENKLKTVEELSGSVPATMTLEEAREERLRKK